MRPPARVCFFGDSFVNGCGDRLSLGWVGRVCARRMAQGAALTAYNLGIRGDTSGQIAQRWWAEARARLSDPAQAALVFSFGANDAAQAVPEAETIATARTILTQAAAFAPTLMIGPAPIADDDAADRRIAQLCSALEHLCQSELGLDYLAIHHSLRHNPAWMSEALANDGAHPDQGGYEALAALVENWPAWQRWFG